MPFCNLLNGINNTLLFSTRHADPIFAENDAQTVMLTLLLMIFTLMIILMIVHITYYMLLMALLMMILQS